MIGENELHRRDGLGIRDSETFTMQAITPCEILLMEVPMN